MVPRSGSEERAEGRVCVSFSPIHDLLLNRLVPRSGLSASEGRPGMRPSVLKKATENYVSPIKDLGEEILTLPKTTCTLLVTCSTWLLPDCFQCSSISPTVHRHRRCSGRIRHLEAIVDQLYDVHHHPPLLISAESARHTSSSRQSKSEAPVRFEDLAAPGGEHGSASLPMRRA